MQFHFEIGEVRLSRWEYVLFSTIKGVSCSFNHCMYSVLQHEHAHMPRIMLVVWYTFQVSVILQCFLPLK